MANANTAFTRNYAPGQVIRAPIAHHDGNYFTDDETLKRIEGAAGAPIAVEPGSR